MLLYHESGIAYTIDWNWRDNGEYPIISFGKFVFAERFHISRNGVELVEVKDYIRVLRSKEVYMKFGVDIFGGVVLLDTKSTALDIYAVDSCLLQETLPISTTSPYTVATYSSTNPMDGSYQDVVDMIDELEKLIPYIRGVTLPIYIFMTLGTYIPRIKGPVKFTLDFLPLAMSTYGDVAAKENPVAARSDFLHGVDSIPADFITLEYNTNPYPYIMGIPRIGLSPLNTMPIGISYKDR